MAGLTEFRNEIIRNTWLMALAAEVISLPVIGFQPAFTCALVLGTAITVMNFILLVSAGEKVMDVKRAGPMVGSYFVRLAIYGAGFFIAIKFGLYAAVGCAAGYVTLNDWTEPQEWNDLSIYDEEDEDWNYSLKEE